MTNYRDEWEKLTDKLGQDRKIHSTSTRPDLLWKKGTAQPTRPDLNWKKGTAQAEQQKDEKPSAYGAFGKLVTIAELRQQLQEMIDPESEHYHPWRASELMRSAIEEKWWDEQEQSKDTGQPYRTDIPDWVYHKPFIDNGEAGLQLQLEKAFRHTLNYLDYGLLPDCEQTPSARTFRHDSGCDLPVLPKPKR